MLSKTDPHQQPRKMVTMSQDDRTTVTNYVRKRISAKGDGYLNAQGEVDRRITDEAVARDAAAKFGLPVRDTHVRYSRTERMKKKGSPTGRWLRPNLTEEKRARVEAAKAQAVSSAFPTAKREEGQTDYNYLAKVINSNNEAIAKTLAAHHARMTDLGVRLDARIDKTFTLQLVSAARLGKIERLLSQLWPKEYPQQEAPQEDDTGRKDQGEAEA